MTGEDKDLHDARASRTINTWRSLCEALVEMHETGDQQKMADVVRVAKKLLTRGGDVSMGTIKFKWKSLEVANRDATEL